MLLKRSLLVLLLIAAAGGMLFAAPKNPDTLIMASFGDVISLDPAVAYDNVSWSMLSIMYDRLLDFDGANLGKFVPKLATVVPTVANGGISKDGKTYTFTIRSGVKFWDGTPLTAEDVAYSFKRAMVTDPDAGPDWIWFQLFLGGSGSRDGDGKIAVSFKDIDNAVTVSGTKVTFHLANPYPAFLSVLAGKWGSIVSKKFCIANWGWDGTEATWEANNNPPTGRETLFDRAMGTGPYKLVRWDKGVETDVTRNDLYWGPRPSLKNGVYRIVEEWSTRKLMLLQGDADIATVNATNYPEMDAEKGITIYKNLPSLDLSGMHFNLNITAKDNPNIYSGKLDGQGIPPDFFADKDVRLGFIYAWDEKAFLKDVTNNNAMDPVTPFPKGLPYKNEKLESKPLDLDKAKQYLQQAMGGKVWEQGIKFDIIYNTGNTERETGAKMLAESVMSLNPKFQIGVRGVEWPVYSEMNKNKQMTIFFLGWAPDYPDPDDYAQPYMASGGYFAGRQSYKNATVDELVAKAAVELDSAKRQAYYYQLQDIWLQDSIAILAQQPLRRRFMKDWVKGYYYSPMESQEFELLPVLRKQ